jgi:hypothetical protein
MARLPFPKRHLLIQYFRFPIKRKNNNFPVFPRGMHMLDTDLNLEGKQVDREDDNYKYVVDSNGTDCECELPSSSPPWPNRLRPTKYQGCAARGLVGLA